MELGKPHASGRSRLTAKKGSEFVMNIDMVVVALGMTPNPLIASATAGLKNTSHGTVVTDGHQRHGGGETGCRRYRHIFKKLIDDNF
jgi:NADPH-dependent glutamate synthase beta subunit-like oxidoreductase